MGHELWHVLVLASTLLGAAALVVGVAAPLLGGRPALGRGRLLLGGLVGMAAILLGAEWLWVH